MAQTKFRVENLNPDFRYQAGSGFWFRANNDGGIDPDANDDGVADDPEFVASVGLSADKPGQWIWLSPADSAVTQYEFVVDGDHTVDGTQANILKTVLRNKDFTWLPHNPAYNSVAPLLKDGVTANPNHDDSKNPVTEFDYSATPITVNTRAQKACDLCLHFKVAVTVI